MPIRNYSVLKGEPSSGKVVFNKEGYNPHYRLYFGPDGHSLECDINVQSVDGSNVLYSIRSPLTLPVEETALTGLVDGITRLDNVPGSLALDYVRERVGSGFLVDEADFQVLGLPSKDGEVQSNPVSDLLDETWKVAGFTVYAFGSEYADSNGAKGLHDIHMNQGNPANSDFAGENGTWQDGGLFIESAAGKWTALFLAFQTQSWMTNDKGDPVAAKTLAQT